MTAAGMTAAFAVQFPDRGPKPDSDVRLADDGPRTPLRMPTPAQRSAAESLARRLPGLSLRWDGMSGSPKWLAAPPGAVLSDPRGASAETAARDFLRASSNLLGLTPTEIASLELTSSVSAPDGGAHLYFTQRVDGLEVYGGRLNVTVRADGAVRWLGSRLYGGVKAPQVSTIDPAAAVSIAVHDVYPDIVFEGRLSRAADDADPERATSYTQDEFGRDPHVRLVLFPGKSATRLAWEVRVGELTLATEYLALVDAENGEILARHNLTAYASARVLNATHPDPEYEEFAPPQHEVLGIPASTPESPQGWLGGDDTTLTGNNASSHLGFEFLPGLSSPTGDYDYAFNTNEAVLTNAWYWANVAHDLFYAAGFDEAAGNFQDDNFGNGGVGGDRVRVVARVSDQGGTYMSRTVDGEPPILSVDWMSDCPFCSDQDGYPENGGDRSLGFGRDLLIHEYAHGVVTRRVGGPADDTCLTGFAWHPNILDQGWSDLFAASFFDDPSIGEFQTFGNGFLLDLRHDSRFADMPLQGSYRHLLWSGPLWDIRQSMAAIDPTGGLDDFHALIVESLAITPCHPTMLEARDAILAADTLLFGSSHHSLLWNVFAARGMGENASVIDEADQNPVPDYTVPAGLECSAPAAPTGLMATVTGDNEITLDYDATGAASVEVRREDLDNPADAPERIAFTTDLARYVDVSVQGGKGYRYHLVALGSAGTLCRSPQSGTSDATATGICTEEFPLFIPDLTVTDAGNSSCELLLTWDPAIPACPGSSEPIVYNVYRANTAAYGSNSPGFLPSDLLLVGRTTSTSFTDAPPENNDDVINQWFNNAAHYLVLAQHGTLADPPDHRDRGSSQVLQWRSGIPTLGRTTVEFWDFDSGEQGWTIDGDPASPHRWAVVDPIPTYYGGSLLAPDEPAGGTGMAFVTGDPGVPPESMATNVCGNQDEVINSPTWDATDGATIVSFDYWARPWEPGVLGNAFAICFGPLDPCTRDVGLMTTQRFNGPGRYGWQRFEIDLSTLMTPSENQGVQFGVWRNAILAEFGIDNVRVERATVCSRSQLDLVSVVVDDSEPGWGNGDGYLQPGEIGRLTVEIGNNGSTTAVAPAGAILSPAPGVSILDPDASFPDIVPSGTALNSDDGFVVAVPETAACTGSVTFELIFTAASGERTTSLWTLELGTQEIDTLLTDDFQTDQGWLSTGAGIGQGVWQRGKPLLTLDGQNIANPVEDSPNDANAFCYVTENTVTGDPLEADVDPGADPVLTSPPLTVDGYKRVTFDFDLWAYCDDDCTDRAFWFLALLDDDSSVAGGQHDFFPRSVWEPHTELLPLDQESSLGSDVRLSFSVFDYVNDDILEAGVDNVLIQGERRVCDPTGINAPNSVGDSLLLGKSATADLQWTAPPVDGTHDAAVFYKVWVSAAPDGGFLAKENPTSPDAVRPLAGDDEYYLISAHNGGGSSN
jgi:extracellular elastinolytic metalloproteinase